MNLHRADVHTLAGAYAMDAISAPDRARFERHLAGCAACAQEITSLREATARLATATAVPPPSSMKERVMAAATLTRQQPPSVSEPSTGRAWRGRLRFTVAAVAAAVVLAVVGSAVATADDRGTATAAGTSPTRS